MSKRALTADEKRYREAVRTLGCVVCRLFASDRIATMTTSAEIHHVESVRDALSEYAIVPLCHAHHEGANGVHGLSRRGFEMRYKLTTIDLLAMTARALHESGR